MLCTYVIVVIRFLCKNGTLYPKKNEYFKICKHNQYTKLIVDVELFIIISFFFAFFIYSVAFIFL
jgi:hypothetical protein